MNTQTQEFYQIDKIMDKKLIMGKLHYLIKWKRYSHRYNTWQPVSNQGLEIPIQQYQRKFKKSNTKNQKQTENANKQKKQKTQNSEQKSQSYQKKLHNIRPEVIFTGKQNEETKNSQNQNTNIYLNQIITPSNIIDLYDGYFQYYKKQQRYIEGNSVLQIYGQRQQSNQQKQYLVRWKSYKGMVPQDSYVKGSLLKKYAQNQLIQYFESYHKYLFK